MERRPHWPPNKSRHAGTRSGEVCDNDDQMQRQRLNLIKERTAIVITAGFFCAVFAGMASDANNQAARCVLVLFAVLCGIFAAALGLFGQP